MTKWKDIKGYEGFYQVSDTGQIRSLDRYDRLERLKLGVIKRYIIQNSGYKVVNLKINGKQKNYLFHRLVTEAFIPNPENKKYVNHIDGNKLNNHVENLEWCTRSENMIHANKIGLANIVNKKKVKLIHENNVTYFESQAEISRYFGFVDDWCHQRVLRNGNPFKYGNYTVEVLG